MVIITTAETHWSCRITLYLTTDFAPWFGGSDGSWFSLDALFLFKPLETVWAFFLVLWVSTGFPARGRSIFSGADLWFCSGPGLRSSSKAVLWSGFPAEDNRNRTKVTFGIYTEQFSVLTLMVISSIIPWGEYWSPWKKLAFSMDEMSRACGDSSVPSLFCFAL